MIKFKLQLDKLIQIGSRVHSNCNCFYYWWWLNCWSSQIYINFQKDHTRFRIYTTEHTLTITFFVCLVLNGTSTQDRSICANCGRVKPTQLAKDGQRDTMHNFQYVTQWITVHNWTLQLQKCNNWLSNPYLPGKLSWLTHRLKCMFNRALQRFNSTPGQIAWLRLPSFRGR